nr:cyclin b3 [Hymenolepis microstoma]
MGEDQKCLEEMKVGLSEPNNGKDENGAPQAKGPLNLVFTLHPENELKNISIQSRLDICKTVEQFYKDTLPTIHDIESPDFVIQSDRICIHDIKKFIKIVEQETELDKSYMCSILTEEKTQLDMEPQFYTNLMNKIILNCTWLNLPMGIAHRAAGLIELYFAKNKSSNMLNNQLVLGCITLAKENQDLDSSIDSDFAKLAQTVGLTVTRSKLLDINYISDCIAENINFPTTLRWLEIFLCGLHEYSPELLKWAKHACNYILDMNLKNANLRKYSPRLRCAAAIWFIRFILRLHCDCRSPAVNCEHRLTALWPKIFVQLSGCAENKTLKRIAYDYGKALLSVNEICVPAFRNKEDVAKYSMVFNTYVASHHDRIAIETKISSFDQTDLDKLECLGRFRAAV